jgi:hypothetical protein
LGASTWKELRAMMWPFGSKNSKPIRNMPYGDLPERLGVEEGLIDTFFGPPEDYIDILEGYAQFLEGSPKDERDVVLGLQLIDRFVSFEDVDRILEAVASGYIDMHTARLQVVAKSLLNHPDILIKGCARVVGEGRDYVYLLISLSGKDKDGCHNVYAECFPGYDAPLELSIDRVDEITRQSTSAGIVVELSKVDQTKASVYFGEHWPLQRCVLIMDGKTVVSVEVICDNVSADPIYFLSEWKRVLDSWLII